MGTCVCMWWSPISAHLDQLEPKVRYRKSLFLFIKKQDSYTASEHLHILFSRSAIIIQPTSVCHIYTYNMFSKSKSLAFGILVFLFFLQNCEYRHFPVLFILVFFIFLLCIKFFSFAWLQKLENLLKYVFIAYHPFTIMLSFKLMLYRDVLKIKLLSIICVQLIIQLFNYFKLSYNAILFITYLNVTSLSLWFWMTYLNKIKLQ